MTVEVGDVIRCVAEWDIPDGTIAQLVYHYLAASGTTATEVQVLTAMEGRLDAAWDNIAAHIANTVGGAQVEGFVWDFVLNRWDGIGNVPLLGADGASISPMTPHGAAALLKLSTAAARRTSRKYIHGMAKESHAAGTLLGAVVTNVSLFGAELDDDLVAGGLTLSYGTFNTEPLSPLFETFSASNGTVLAEAIMAYQRRRRPGTGI